MIVPLPWIDPAFSSVEVLTVLSAVDSNAEAALRRLQEERLGVRPPAASPGVVLRHAYTITAELHGPAAAIGELLLEGGQQGKARLALQSLDRAPQDMARAEVPRRAFEGFDVAKKKILRGAALERHQHAGRRIGNEKNLAPSAEGRHLDGAEGGDENIGGRQTDAA